MLSSEIKCKVHPKNIGIKISSTLTSKEIFTKLGYDPALLGVKRIEGFVYHLRKEKLTDEQRVQSTNRALKVRRPSVDTKYSEMKSQDTIRAMEAELIYLRQEVEFLKKISQLEKSKKSED